MYAATKMDTADKCKSYCITRQVLISCLICQVLTNISVMAVGACIAIDPRKAEVKGHGFIMLILSVMFLCILAAGAVGTIGEYTSILLLFAGLMVVGFLVGGFTHLMVSLTAAPEESLQKLSVEDYKREISLGDLWDHIQKRDKCCGIAGPGDWLQQNMSIPSSCCHSSTGNGDPTSSHCSKFNSTGFLYQRGCLKLPKIDYSEFQSNEPDVPKKLQSNFKDSVIYIMIFDYLSKIVCIVAALALAWLLW